jgi:hypothetical protein
MWRDILQLSGSESVSMLDRRKLIERVAAYAKDHSIKANSYGPNRHNYLDSNH